MNGFSKKHGRWTDFLVMLLAVALMISLPLPFLPHERAEASGTQMANVVIFVRLKSDNRDIFNAQYSSGSITYSNWQRIKRMYDEGTGTGFNNSFANYISVVTENNVRVTNYFPQENPDKKGVKVYTLPSDSDGGGSGLVESAVS